LDWTGLKCRAFALDELHLREVWRQALSPRTLILSTCPALGGDTAIQELAGHESLTTTQRYMHLTPAAKDAAISLLDTAGPPACWRHAGDGLCDAGKDRWVRKGEGPGIVEVSLWIPGPSFGEEYGT
jgi:hypothetical protein